MNRPYVVECEWCDSERYEGRKRSIIQAKADKHRHEDYGNHWVGGPEVSENGD